MDFIKDQRIHIVAWYNLNKGDLEKVAELFKEKYGPPIDVRDITQKLLLEDVLPVGKPLRKKGINKVVFYSSYVEAGGDFNLMMRELGVSQERMVALCVKYSTLPKGAPKEVDTQIQRKLNKKTSYGSSSRYSISNGRGANFKKFGSS